jgi:crotonobetainyl-CoA:carnitine CoA-transferase CaiB-like acyl-CoA transferase
VLARDAQGVVNNLRGDLPATLGIDYASLKSANPAIVCLHISAYGRDNSRAGWPGYDFLMQAEAGLMSLTGDPDRAPTRIGVSMVDYMTGVTGALGLLSAMMRARATGEGCDVDTNLFDVALHQLAYTGTWFLNSGQMPSRLPRSAHQSVAPVQTVKTADGWVYVMCMMDKFWVDLAEIIGRPELVKDPRFATQGARRANREALSDILDEIMATKPSAAWLDLLAGKIPIAPVYDVAQAFANAFVAENDMITAVAHPQNPQLRVLANPIRINGERLAQTAGPPLGADNDALLGPATEL